MAVLAEMDGIANMAEMKKSLSCFSESFYVYFFKPTI